MMEQMKKYGVECNGITPYHFWNAGCKGMAVGQKTGIFG